MRVPVEPEAEGRCAQVRPAAGEVPWMQDEEVAVREPNRPCPEHGNRWRPLPERFWEKVDRSGGETACWPWTGRRTEDGYGQIWVEDGATRAHRVAWAILRGPLPQGAHVLHACDNPPCVNPSHLFLGDNAANMRDRTAKGRYENQRKAECPRGHPYDAANTRIGSHGSRCCRACAREKFRERYRSDPAFAERHKARARLLTAGLAALRGVGAKPGEGA